MIEFNANPQLLRIIVLCISAFLVVLICKWRKKAYIRRKIRRLSRGKKSITPKQFFELRSASFGIKKRSSYASQCNFSGVYILYNKTRHMHYIGQATRVLDRLNAHFTGKGNGDVYADYKYGDRFSIKMIALKHSKYPTLNELERKMIEKYDSFAKGYNKTRGNRG